MPACREARGGMLLGHGEQAAPEAPQLRVTRLLQQPVLLRQPRPGQRAVHQLPVATQDGVHGLAVGDRPGLVVTAVLGLPPFTPQALVAGRARTSSAQMVIIIILRCRCGEG